MISVEGIKLKAKPIQKKQLLTLWKTLTSKPYPRVKAFKLSNRDFDRVIRLRWCKEDQLRESSKSGTTFYLRKALTPAYSTLRKQLDQTI